MKLGTVHGVNFFWVCPRASLKWLGVLFFLLMGEAALAQGDRKTERWFSQARQHFSMQSYEQAVDFCERILKRDSGYVDAYLLLADIFSETQQVEKEVFYLEKASGLTDNQLVSLRLGSAHYSTGKYARALIHFKNYLQNASSDSKKAKEVKRKMDNCRFALKAIENPVAFQPDRLPAEVNSPLDEYWPSLTIDGQQLVFTRLMETPGHIPQEDFYMSEWDSSGWGKAQAVKELNTPENEGAQSLSGDGKFLFFTACNRQGGMGSCDIYYSVLENGQWSRPVNAGPPVNTPYWEAQPAISADGRMLYFTSNRPGGKGEKDIWRVECRGFNANGRLEWGNPVNAGDSINTPGNEISPFMHASNKSFYFASDYHTGMGGTDLFMAILRNDSVFSRPKNLGYPLNTRNNEQGLFINTSGETAFFASERNESTGLDIFSFTLDESIRPEPATYVHAKVLDSLTGHPVQAQVELVDLTHGSKTFRSENSGPSGEVLLCLPAGANYAFSVSKSGYLFYSDAFHLSEPRHFYDPYELTIRLKPVKAGAEMNLYNIYFATDSFSILPPSEPELMKLVDFLKNNPGLEVEVQGHTDTTGSTERNRELSVLRARSVAEYLVDHGISPSRLKTAGYGAERPVATNETPDGRRMNRRTTIKILNE